MRMQRLLSWGVWAGLIAVTTPPLGAAVVPSDTPIQAKSYSHPDLNIGTLERPAGELDAGLVSDPTGVLQSLGAQSDGGFYDWRSGGWGSLIVSVPLVPGTGVGNSLKWGGVLGAAPANDSELQQRAVAALFRYLSEHQGELRINPSEASTPNAGAMEKGTLIQVHAPRVFHGVVVRDSGVTGIINHGNLVLLGMQNWGAVDAATAPGIKLEDAKATLVEHLRPFEVSSYLDAGHLELIPLQRGDGYANVVPGLGYTYRLAWVMTVEVSGQTGTWEALVDASNRELIAFQDKDLHAVRRAIGGVYPLSNDQRPPDGIEQAGWPMPFANITSSSPAVFTTTGGIVPACITGNMSTTLNGQYMRMNDTCGAINETSAGDIDLGVSAGTDCVVPAGHSVGDTHSSRSGFYELNRIKEQARAYLPANAWLQAQLTANMNLNQTCNAFWNGTTVNFFKSSAQCRNTGEIAAIFDHEWGHGLDDNGINGNVTNPGEAIADIRSTMRLDNSCVGRGFFKNQVCGGYGDPCTGTPATGCTGVRDADFANHVSGLPHGITWILSNCGGGAGPCGREVHCEGQVGSEAAWDLQFRDLRAGPFNYDESTALELSTRLWYLGAETMTNYYTCAAGCNTAGTCGCGATGAYMLLLAADDDNGNINDGTPHMAAINSAFTRHQLQCNVPAVVNSGCAGGPTTATTLTAVATGGGVNLSWTPVAGASMYGVFRTEGVQGCNYGKIKIGETANTNFSDTGLLDGRSYFYSILPIGANPACLGLMSNCGTAVPTLGTDPCGGGNTNSMSFALASSSVGEAGGNAPIDVMLTTSDSLPSSQACSVSYATADGTATGGSDYTPASGSVSFPAGTPNGATQAINVAIMNDAVDEPDETFSAALSNPTGGTIGGISSHTVTILDDDAAVDLTIGDVSALEGNAGNTDFMFPVTLSAPSGGPVSADFTTQDGTATTADNDYVPITGTIVFNPGETLHNVTVSVVGDLNIEADETFFVSLSNVTGANVVDGVGQGTIINDDVPLPQASKTELIHGSNLGRNLVVPDFFPIRTHVHQSWEVVVDATTGDIVGSGGPEVVRLDSDGTTVIQTATAIGTGVSKSLRWENAGATSFDGFVRVQSLGCTTNCTPEDSYRIRSYDTSYGISRFNNSATQITILVIQNTSTDTVTGTIWLWDTAGAPVTTQPLNLTANATLVLNTASVAPGAAGTITVTHNGRYASLAGKAVAVEPATGFTFDTPMVPKAR
jgi:Calx-beta domain